MYYKITIYTLILLFTLVTVSFALNYTKNSITIGINNNYPPFEYINKKGEITGFDVDIVRAVCKEIGINYNIESGVWSIIRSGVENNTIDISAGMLYSEERAKKVIFSIPHTIVHYSIFIRSTDNKKIKTIEDLQNKCIIVEKGSLMHDFLVAKAVSSNIILVDSEPDALKLLSGGKQDCALVPNIYGRIYTLENRMQNILPVGKPIFSVELCFAASMSNRILIEQLNTGLYNIKSSGLYKTIYDKWFGILEPAGIPLSKIFQYAVFILVPIVLILSLLLFFILSFYRKLKIQSGELLLSKNNLQTALDVVKKCNTEIKILNEDLESRVTERTLKLQDAIKELESFSYSISHDLRAPIRAIDSFSKIILSEHSNLLEPEASKLLTLICQNTLKMGKLIDDLLSFSRLGRQDVRSISINMDDLFRECYNEQKKLLPERNIEYIQHPMPKSYGDYPLIQQVVVNLLSNSIKFTRNKDKAVIETGSLTKDNEIIYYVKDNGAGFDMNYMNKLFGVFQRLHSEKEFEGTGVGLAIANRIISKHTGKIWAESREDEGTVFYFTIPLKKII